MSSKEKLRILISDSLAKEGVEQLQNAGFEVKMDASLDGDSLKKEIPGYDGLLIRSGTTVTQDIIENADKLKIIGRAGVGVDNIDIEAATRKGIVVMNTPGGNTISACEHAWALMMSLLRNVPPAHQALREGRWDKKLYKGTELFGKTLGVIGLGKIGFEVARRAVGFGMKIIAFDPFSTEEKASEIGAKLVKDLDDILANADIITVHVPKNEKTLNMINTESIGKMKAGAFLINCARGGIVNEEDLANAVKNGKLKGAAVDVYTSEPTTDSPVFSVDGIIHTPHLGASTSEAQERVAMDVVKQLIEYFESDKIVNAVNIAGAKIDSSIEELAHKIGIMCGQLSDKLTQRIVISYKENIKGDHEEAVTRAVLNGYLSQFNEGINYINAMMIADEKGIDVVRQMETRRGKPGDLGVSLNGKLEISGGVVGKVTRLTGIDEYTLDIPLNGNFLIIKNADVPGVIGHIGTVLGEYSVNIANMEVGRSATGGQAVTVIGVDQEISAEVIEKLKSQESIIDVKTIKVGQ